MLEIKNISKKYVVGDFKQVALDDVSVNFRKSEFASILGPSGSGKTTLLNIIGGLDHYDTGDLIINGVSTKKYKDSDWDSYRNHRIGFVFQSYNLISHQTILANVELALTLSGISKKERVRIVRQALMNNDVNPGLNELDLSINGSYLVYVKDKNNFKILDKTKEVKRLYDIEPETIEGTEGTTSRQINNEMDTDNVEDTKSKEKNDRVLKDDKKQGSRETTSDIKSKPITKELDNSSFSSPKYSISEKTGKLQENGKDIKLDTSDTGTTGTLMAMHNLSEDKMNGLLELNGIPVPSIAITNPEIVEHKAYGDKIIGNRTNIKVVKNKVAPPFKSAAVDIMYGEGVSHEGEIVEIASEIDILEKSGAWYAYNGEKIGQGRENAKEYLKNNSKICLEIENKIREHYGFSKKNDKKALTTPPVGVWYNYIIEVRI